jgi:hypothetical protein
MPAAHYTISTGSPTVEPDGAIFFIQYGHFIMRRDGPTSPQTIDEFSAGKMQLLRDRIGLSKREELLGYLDFLIPSYEMPAGRIGSTANTRQKYHWSEFLEFYGEDFIRNAYLCILKREADAAAVQSAAGNPDADDCSRIILLGHLRYSEEGRAQATQIEGLWASFHYQLASLERKPFRRRRFGFLMRLQSAFRSRIDAALANQRREIEECRSEIVRLEMRLMQHYDDTLKHVKREVAEALTADITQ